MKIAMEVDGGGGALCTMTETAAAGHRCDIIHSQELKLPSWWTG